RAVHPPGACRPRGATGFTVLLPFAILLLSHAHVALSLYSSPGCPDPTLSSARTALTQENDWSVDCQARGLKKNSATGTAGRRGEFGGAARIHQRRNVSPQDQGTQPRLGPGDLIVVYIGAHGGTWAKDGWAMADSR